MQEGSKQDNQRKGIILAGGNGTRLYPTTKAVSKQLLPVYNKPMIYYPLTTLMLSGIKQILIITKPNDLTLFMNLIGDGRKWGLEIEYQTQEQPRGLVEALLIAEDFIGNSPIALILGDNIFHGDEFISTLTKASSHVGGATVFAYSVGDPERYGVVEFDEQFKVQSLEEKPIKPKSNFVITGLYFYDNSVIDRAKMINPSARGEVEITDLNNSYFKDYQLNVVPMGRGIAWFDTGTYQSLYDASVFIKTLEQRQGLKIGSPEEVAWRKGLITKTELNHLAHNEIDCEYKDYLLRIIE